MKKFSFTQPLTPDLCGKQPKMQPPAAFLLFQNAASLHAEAIGNGTAALAERDCYWVATHSKIDFYNDANLLDMLTVSTWVNPAKPNAVRGYRGYDIFVGDKQIAEGLTEWVVLNRETGFVRFSEFGFPDDFEFQDYVACGGKLCRFRDEFTDDDEVYTFTVRTSSIDIGRHMNNVAYVRAFLDCFTADEVASMPVKTMEARYITACMEGEELKIFKKRTDTGFVLGARRADGKCAAFLGTTLK